jgi:hypothetical protein
MSHTELDRFGVITRVRERRLTQVAAARILDLGVRQVQRLCAAVYRDGADGLISRKRGRPSSRRFPDKFRRSIVTLISAHYSDFGPTSRRALQDSIRRSRSPVQGVRPIEANSPSRYRQQQTFGFRAHDGTRGSTRKQRAPQQELPLAAVSDCQQHAVRFFPEHRCRDPKGPVSAHVAPVRHMHYDAACPQWNG